MIWQTRRGPLDLAHRARVMGILNVTPDSFCDGGRYADRMMALDHARRLIAAGADIIDIGGESTRPGALPVSAEDEITRILPVITLLRAEWDGLISIDTMKVSVAAAALAAGADIVNDVSGLRADSEMSDLCAASGCGVVVMHMQGEPRTMQQSPRYQDVVFEVRAFFQERLETLVNAGINPAALCFDPGIGFGKNLDHNLALLASLDAVCPQGHPLLLGVSRKSCIARLLENDDLALRDWPTVAITALARQRGVMLHRVHDVRPNLEALRMTEAILGN